MINYTFNDYILDLKELNEELHQQKEQNPNAVHKKISFMNVQCQYANFELPFSIHSHNLLLQLSKEQINHYIELCVKKKQILDKIQHDWTSTSKLFYTKYNMNIRPLKLSQPIDNDFGFNDIYIQDIINNQQKPFILHSLLSSVVPNPYTSFQTNALLSFFTNLYAEKNYLKECIHIHCNHWTKTEWQLYKHLSNYYSNTIYQFDYENEMEFEFSIAQHSSTVVETINFSINHLQESLLHFLQYVISYITNYIDAFDEYVKVQHHNLKNLSMIDTSIQNILEATESTTYNLNTTKPEQLTAIR